MSIISQFLGIVITMYFYDHAPPHFHASYGDYEITVDIKTGIVNGYFPNRAMRLVKEWHKMHKDELQNNWKLCQSGLPLTSIKPLE